MTEAAIPSTAAEFREIYELCVTVPRRKVPYIVNRGSGWSNPDWRWRWCCPCCAYAREDTDRAALMALIDLHRCKARESLRWHPRYRMPPRWQR